MFVVVGDAGRSRTFTAVACCVSPPKLLVLLRSYHNEHTEGYAASSMLSRGKNRITNSSTNEYTKGTALLYLLKRL